MTEQSLNEQHWDQMALAKKSSTPAALSHFYARIERMTGQGREAKPRCRPRLEESTNDAPLPEQGELGLRSTKYDPGFFFQTHQ